MKPTTVYIPVKVKKELPKKGGGYFVIRENGAIATDSCGIKGSKFWSDTKSWLKPSEGYFFTKDQLAKLISDAHRDGEIIGSSQNYSEGMAKRMRELFLSKTFK